MKINVAVLAVLLLAAVALVCAGVAMMHTPTALIIGGVLVGGWAVLIFTELPDGSEK